MSKQSDQIIIALDFWNVVTEKSSLPITRPEKIMLDYMYGKISAQSAITEFQSCGHTLSHNNLTQSVEESGWSIIFESAGEQNFVRFFQSTIQKLRKALPNTKIGIAANDIPQFSEMLNMVGIAHQLDFVLNSSLIGCKKPSPDFFDQLRNTDDDRIIVIETPDNEPIRVSGVETIHYDNRLTTNDLYETIIEYLNFN